MAVVVRNGCKRYGDGVPVLDNLNLNVEPGSIYGLLGSSGCGKTTILSCIVGLRTLDAGEISVFGHSPGEKGSGIPGVCVGYMPQETTSLHFIFTIKETFWFYGRIYGLKTQNIEKQINFLTTFLQLPDLSLLLANLSGGQLRRVSLGVTMIHQAPLMLLDEPTVGLDPLLRERIWEYLKELVTKNKKTIILTTHYTEEAKSCDMIGVMRKGRLIVEENPQTILSHYDSLSLEAVVLQLCHQDEQNVPTNFQPCQEISSKTTFNKRPFKIPYRNRIQHNVIIVMAMMYKGLVMIKRHPGVLAAQLLLPVINIVLYNNIAGNDPKGLKIGFSSDEIWPELNNTGLPDFCFNYEKNRSCFGDSLSTICTFVNQFEQNGIDWVAKPSAVEALSSVQKGDTIGYLSLPNNFSYHLKDRFLFRNQADNTTVHGSTMTVRLDNSNVINTVWLTQHLLKRLLTYVEQMVTNCEVDPRFVQLPLKFNAVYGEIDDKNQTWRQFIQPFVIIMFMCLIASAPSIYVVLEKRLGITDRFTVAGVKFGHTLISTVLFDSCIIMCQICIMFYVLSYFYGMTVKGSWLLCFLLVYFTTIGAVACGMLLSILVTHEMEIIMLIMLINSLNMISTGGLSALESIPYWYRIFCQFIPACLPIDALRAIMFRGWGVEKFIVFRGFAISIFYVVLFFAISFWFNKKKK